MFKEYLISFMEKKKKQLNKHIVNDYFLEEDSNDIYKWSSKDAEKVWKLLKTLIYKYNVKGLMSTTCPFCMYTNINQVEKNLDERLPIVSIDCRVCTYGKRHGVCNLHTSEYKRIVNSFSHMDSFITILFSNTFYQHAIFEILPAENEQNK